MTKRGKNQDWLELHFRKADAPTPRGLGDLSCSDYEVRGHRIRDEELECFSNLLGMFRKVPEGMEDWFDRGMQALDMIVLCRTVNGRVRTYPLIVATRDQLPDFVRSESTKVVKPVYWNENGERVAITDLFVVAVDVEWSSLCVS